MSWTFDGVGRAPKVAAHMRETLSKYRCKEPEESIKNAAVDLVEKALSGFASDRAVMVRANGHQDEASGGEVKCNTLNLTIQPLYGFIE